MTNGPSEEQGRPDPAMQRLQGMLPARHVLDGWAGGAQAMALVEAVHEAGWLGFLAEPRTLTALADFTGLPAPQLEDVLGALTAHGIVERDTDLLRLTSTFELLSADDASVDLADLLAYHRMLPRLVRNAITTAHGTPAAAEDALVLAKAVGGRVSPVSQSLFRLLVDSLPEYDVLRHGGRLLDVGCGVGWAMLDLATLYPQGRQVGIELVPEVAAEARRRAQELGVQDRVDVRCQDAQTFDDDEAFDAAFWAQPFFPASSRAGTLKMLLRVLKPGGILLMQELFVRPDAGDEAAARAFAMSRLLYGQWDIPFAASAEELSDEAAAAGFEQARLAEIPLGRVVIMRRPL